MGDGEFAHCGDGVVLCVNIEVFAECVVWGLGWRDGVGLLADFGRDVDLLCGFAFSVVDVDVCVEGFGWVGGVERADDGGFSCEVVVVVKICRVIVTGGGAKVAPYPRGG